MISVTISLFYVLAAVLVGLCALGRRPGFLIAFILSLVVSPFLVLLGLYLTRPRPVVLVEVGSRTAGRLDRGGR